MDEDENRIARRRRLKNEHQARYRARKPSEARRQVNAESQRISRLTTSPKLLCDKEFTSLEHLFTKSSSFDGFQLVIKYFIKEIIASSGK